MTRLSSDRAMMFVYVTEATNMACVIFLYRTLEVITCPLPGFVFTSVLKMSVAASHSVSEAMNTCSLFWWRAFMLCSAHEHLSDTVMYDSSSICFQNYSCRRASFRCRLPENSQALQGAKFAIYGRVVTPNHLSPAHFLASTHWQRLCFRCKIKMTWISVAVVNILAEMIDILVRQKVGRSRQLFVAGFVCKL